MFMPVPDVWSCQCDTLVSICSCAQGFIEDVKSRGPYIYSVLESAQTFLAQHPFQEPEETLPDGKGLFSSDEKWLMNHFDTFNFKCHDVVLLWLLKNESHDI